MVKGARNPYSSTMTKRSLRLYHRINIVPLLLANPAHLSHRTRDSVRTTNVEAIDADCVDGSVALTPPPSTNAMAREIQKQNGREQDRTIRIATCDAHTAKRRYHPSQHFDRQHRPTTYDNFRQSEAYKSVK